MNSRKGTGSVFQRGQIWWISYYYAGRRYREAVPKAGNKSQAVRVLADGLASARTNQMVILDFKLSFDGLMKLIRTEYAVKGRRSTPR